MIGDCMEDKGDIVRVMEGVPATEQLLAKVEEHDLRLSAVEKSVEMLGKSMETLEKNSTAVVNVLNGMMPWVRRAVGLLALVGMGAIFDIPPETFAKFVDVLNKLGGM